jgi:tetratricopeptide (TPR) repeat protein
LPPYAPPPPPAPDTIPDPGLLPPGFRIPFQRNALFTGRVEPLQALARALLEGDGRSALVTQAVAGMGGVGKTQLAVEFAHRYGRYFHGVHWVNAGEAEGMGAEVAACGAAMGLPDWPEKQPEQIARTLSEWQRGGRRLVVLDSLEKVEAAREWLGRLGGGPLCVLVTARRADWPRDLGILPLRLEVFSPEESRAFLRRYLPSPSQEPVLSKAKEEGPGVRVEAATDADLDALAERLYHLPLALELAGRYLAQHARLSIRGYLERVERVWEHPSMAGWRADLGNPTGHELSLAATFAVSWQRVRDETARRLFLLAGYCAANQPIPCELLEQAAGIEREACDESLSILTELGLLEMGDAEAGPTIHPLLAEYARTAASLSPGGERAGVRGDLPALADALARLARAANDQMDQTGSPSHFVRLLPHVRWVAETAEREGLEDAANLWGNLGYYLQRVADHAGARAAFERALAIDERAFGPEHPNVAIRVNNLGGVLRALGDLAGARAAFERALAIDERAFGPEHPNVAILVNNLGNVLQDLGDLAGARAAYERALAILQAAYGDEHPQVATAYNNLGRVLWALGDLAGARVACERALAIDERVFGPDHPNVARDVNNLGSVLHTMGDLAGARAAYERALRIFEKFLPPEHPSIRTVRGNLEGLGRAARGEE